MTPCATSVSRQRAISCIAATASGRSALLAILFVLMPLSALAHAQLRASSPDEGAILRDAPAAVILEFNETVEAVLLRHRGPDGIEIDLEAASEGATVRAITPFEYEDGTHLLSWRVVSADGHTVGGTLTFHIGAPSSVPPTPAELAAGAARMGSALRFVLTSSLVIAVGAAVFAALVARAPAGPSVSRMAIPAALAAFPVGVLFVGVQGLDMLALPPSALLTYPPWQAGLSSVVAVTVVLSVVAASVALGALRRVNATLRIALALSAWALASLSFAVSGHAATAGPRVIAMSAISLHAATFIYWIGSLGPLLLALRGDDAGTLLRRFSAIAVAMVGVLALSGAALTLLQAGSPADLVNSAYGAVLAAKLSLVLALVAFAARNRLLLTPDVNAGSHAARKRLSRAIGAEIVLGLAILALASTFRLTPPPRVLTERADPVFAHIHSELAIADIRVTPGRVGPVSLTLGFQTGDFGALVPRIVEVVLATPDDETAPIRLNALQGGDGLWHAGPVRLQHAGDWLVNLHLLIADAEPVILSATINIPD